MSLTRRQLVVRSGAAAAWVAAGGAAVAKRQGLFDEAAPFQRSAYPEPGQAAVAVLEATGYDGDLAGVVGDGLRLVGADVRRRSVLLKPNFVEFHAGSPVNTDPRMVVAAADALRRLGATSVVVAEGPGHRRDSEAVIAAAGLRDALDDAGLRFVDLNDAPLAGRRCAPRTRACASSGFPGSCERRTSSSRCRSSRPTTGSGSRSR